MEINKIFSIIIFLLFLIQGGLFSSECNYYVVYKVDKKEVIFKYESGEKIYRKRYGYINKDGKIVIPFKYEYAKDFFEGLGVVMLDGKWGYIDCNENFVIKPKYDDALEFSEERAAVKIKENWYIIDKQGRLIKNKSFGLGYNSYYKEGMMKVSNEDPEHLSKYGYIDREGDLVIPFVYGISSRDFSEGLALVEKDGKYEFINKKGETIISEVKILNDKRRDTYIEINDCKSFSEGYAAVKINDKWGFINRKGELVIKPQYEDVKRFSEGIAGIRIKDEWGFINKRGKIVIKPDFDMVYSFKDGSVIVEKYVDICMIINKKGEYLSKFGFVCGGNVFFKNNVYKIYHIKNVSDINSADWLYLTTKGKIIWKGEGIIVLKENELKEFGKFEN